MLGKFEFQLMLTYCYTDKTYKQTHKHIIFGYHMSKSSTAFVDLTMKYFTLFSCSNSSSSSSCYVNDLIDWLIDWLQS